MSRQRLVVSFALALGVAAALFALAACGGSSSETPPPLEPDPRGFHYAPAQAELSDESDADDAPRSAPRSEKDQPKPRAQPAGTGGGSKPAAK